jgi:DNA-directed RNA polymerase specialized sigma24 family protein
MAPCDYGAVGKMTSDFQFTSEQLDGAKTAAKDVIRQWRLEHIAQDVQSLATIEAWRMVSAGAVDGADNPAGYLRSAIRYRVRDALVRERELHRERLTQRQINVTKSPIVCTLSDLVAGARKALDGNSFPVEELYQMADTRYTPGAEPEPAEPQLGPTISKLLPTLKGNERRFAELYFVDGWTAAMISEHLGIGYSTARAYIRTVAAKAAEMLGIQHRPVSPDKACQSCAVPVTEENAYKLRNSKDGLDYYCKPCRLAKNREANKKHRLKKKAAQLLQAAA